MFKFVLFLVLLCPIRKKIAEFRIKPKTLLGFNQFGTLKTQKTLQNPNPLKPCPDYPGCTGKLFCGHLEKDFDDVGLGFTASEQNMTDSGFTTN
jgi:hypothetical protein